MKFIDGHTAAYDLTYSDVFMVPQYSEVRSRFDVALTTPDKAQLPLPIIVANMNAVAGKRMTETIARRGGVTVLPQDLSEERITKIVSRVKDAHTVFESPVYLGPKRTIYEALQHIHKRAHGIVVVVDDANKPVGIFTEKDGLGRDSFTPLEAVMSREIFSLKETDSLTSMYTALETARVNAAPIINKAGELVGVMSQKGALRSLIYTPALDAQGRLRVAAAIGINGDVAGRTKHLLDIGVDILVVDTAHGHQQRTIEAVEIARRTAGKKAVIVAGNVVTSQATTDLITAGADIVKVGVGPGAMCTTRMMTGVGRPQFSAVLECAEAARKKGAHVWADGGVRHPRDVALALAAGASGVMFASWLAGTYESASDLLRDEHGRLYKENYGMASNRAVKNRVSTEHSLERAKKELFEEGISNSRLYLDPGRPGVEDIVDHIVAGVRSACTYAGANSINDFHAKAVIGIQSASGYQEGAPVQTSWT